MPGAQAVYAAAALPTGLLLLMCGVRLVRTTVAASSFAASALGMHSIASNCLQLPPMLHFALCAASGVIGCIIGLWVWPIAVLVLGALTGAIVAVFVLLHWPQAASHAYMCYGILAVAAFVGATTAGLHGRPIAIAATAMLGAAILASLADQLLHTGLTDAVLSALELDSQPLAHLCFSGAITPALWLAWTTAGIAALGASFQSFVSGRPAHQRCDSIASSK